MIAELQWEPSIRAAHNGMEVEDGVVTLAGKADSYSEKINAERVAQRVSGVKALVTELKLQLSGMGNATTSALPGQRGTFWNRTQHCLPTQ